MSPDRILDIAGAFRSSEILLSALDLGVFTELGRGPRSGGQLQRALHIAPATAPSFFDSLVALDLLRREGVGDAAIYVNSREAAQFLDARSAMYLGDELRAANRRLEPMWRRFADSLREGRAP